MRQKPKPQKISFIEKGFPVSINSYRGINYPQDYHYHTFVIEIQYVFSGSGFYFIGGERYPFRSNSIFLIHKYDIHSYIPGKDSNFIDKVSIIFSPSIFKIILPYYRDILNTVLKCDKNILHNIQFQEEDSIESEILVKQLIKEWKSKKPYYQETILNILLRLIILIDRAILKNRSSNLLEKEPKNKITSSIISYVDINYNNEDLTVLNISKNVFYSVNYISSIFKRYTGISIKEYIIEKRISEAKKLLIETDLKILAIVFEVGFSSLGTFNRNFKRLTGLVPSRYRRFWILNSKK